MQYIKTPQDVLFTTKNEVEYYITRNSSYVIDTVRQYLLTLNPLEDINYDTWHKVFVIAVKDNIVVGHGMIQFSRYFYHTVAFFHGMYVVQEYRNAGIGNELLRVRLEICNKMKNVALITAKTDIGCIFSTYSVRNLQKNGFKRTTNEDGQNSVWDLTKKQHAWELVI
jgi:GNAT superfamily N-acetyltransferase